MLRAICIVLISKNRVRVRVLNVTFNNIIGGGNWSTRKKPPTYHKALTDYIT
jgi:hypothetical protein